MPASAGHSAATRVLLLLQLHDVPFGHRAFAHTTLASYQLLSITYEGGGRRGCVFDFFMFYMFIYISKETPS